MTLSIPENVTTYKLNIEQTGFYRVKYDTTNLHELGTLIATKAITPQDRFGIQNDMYAFVRSGIYPLDDYLNFLDYFTVSLAWEFIGGMSCHIS